MERIGWAQMPSVQRDLLQRVGPTLPAHERTASQNAPVRFKKFAVLSETSSQLAE